MWLTNTGAGVKMDSHYSLNNIDSLLLQLVLQTRELSQTKSEINHRVKVCRAEIAKRRSDIQTVHRNIKKLEEEISVKQSSVMHIRANTKSMKTTNNLLLQYEQTVKAELESRKANYNRDTEDFEESIAGYRKTFQLHKEYYFRNPIAQKLLALQAEKEVIESRIKACEDVITMKQQELDHLTGAVVASFPTDTLPDSIFCQQPMTDEDKHFQTEDGDSFIDMSSLHLNQTGISQNGHKTSAEANTEEIQEENQVQDSATCCTSPERPSKELWSSQQSDAEYLSQSRPEELHSEELGQGTSQEDQQQPPVSGEEEVPEDEMPERDATDEDQAASEEHSDTVFPQTSSQAANPQLFPAKAAPTTPTFAFNFSPANSPHQAASDTKSPAFLFALNSNPSTPGFSGFEFDAGSSQEEESSFAFTGSFFNEKKTTESQSARCPSFLFDQPEQSEDFQFAFTSKSPEPADKETTGDGFPFSFNF